MSSSAARAQCYELLSSNPYDVEKLLGPLERCLELQCTEGWCDPDLNTHLLKLYQMFPHEDQGVVKADTLTRVLLKSLMQLPDPDYALAMMLLPEPLHRLPHVVAIAEMADRLQAAKFVEFWQVVKANTKVVTKVVGFEAAARKFILKAVGMTFREVSGHVLVAWLGLGQVEDLTSGVLDSSLALDLTSVGKTGLVVFPPNPDNHQPRASLSGVRQGPGAAGAGGAGMLSEVPKVEQFAGLVQALRKASAPSSSTTASPAALEAAAKMKKDIGVAVAAAAALGAEGSAPATSATPAVVVTPPAAVGVAQ